MARKKTSRTDKSGTRDGATEDVTTPTTETQETPEPLGPQSPEAGSDTAEASAGNAAPPHSNDQDSPAGDTPQETEGEVEKADATPDPDTTPDARNTTEAQAGEGESPDDSTDTPPPDDDAPTPEATEDTASGDMGTAPDDAATPPAGDETATSRSDHTEDTAPVVRTEQVTVRQGGFWSMLIGGIAAAGIGVAAAPYIYPYLPTGPAPADDGTGAIEARLDDQAQRISDLGARIDDIPAPADPSDEISGLSETVTSLADRVAKLEVQFSNLEVPPAPEAPDSAATDAALAELRDSLAAQSAEIEDLRATLQAEEQTARDSARATLQRAALTRVMTALDTGESFATALSDLRETGAAVPDALAEVAETGAPTRAQLVESFPDAARAALAAARAANSGDEGGLSVRGFLEAQLGVRSLEPREGDDPDAVLSRAEAALAEGRLGDALAEIETLPEGARAALSGWAAEAATRRDALAAAEALSAELN